MKWLLQNKLILLLAIVKFLLPFVIVNSVWELQRDEYLYYEQGRHLAFGYMENPALIGFLAYISSLFGDSVFLIKFWPALFGAMTLIVTAGIAKQLGGKIFAQAVAASGIIFSSYMRIHFLFQPNFLEIFFWALGTYYLLRYINTQDHKYLYLLSFALSLGWWSKYSAAFFIAAIFLSILITKHRTLLTKKDFWFALLLALILVLPNILWHYYHNFPLIHHMKELRETQLKYINKADFLKDQVLMLLPSFVIWFGGLIWLLMNNRYRIIAFIYLLVLILLMTGSGKSYYMLGAYPMLIAAGAVWLEKISVTRIWIRYAAVSLMVLLGLLFVPILLPVQSPSEMAAFNQKHKLERIGLLKWEDQQNHELQQDFADMLGWKEMAQKVSIAYEKLDSTEKKETILFCDNYGQAGAVNFYGQKYRLPKVYSINGSFLWWLPDSIHVDNMILLTDEEEEMQKPFIKNFSSAIVEDSVTNPLARERGSLIITLKGANEDFNKMFTEKIEKEKKLFR